jgi:hypothetical protein
MTTQKNNPETMKVILTMIVMFGLQINFLFAVNPVENSIANNFSNCRTCLNNTTAILLAPITPAEATFSDEAADAQTVLAPTTPSEASFEDEAGFTDTFIPEDLAPETPSEASFEDETGFTSTFIQEFLAPSTPSEADFND